MANKSNRFVEPKFTVKEIALLNELWNADPPKKPADKKKKATTPKSK